MMIEKLYAHYLAHPLVQTDTRKLNPGEIFFALKGPNFNANQFASAALERGASLFVADEPIPFNDERIFYVPDTLTALQELALYHRRKFAIPFLAITGSNGKTTTKELVHSVLSAAYKTYTTQGNLNNHIGIPLTLLQIKPDAEMAVIEMGANHLKEIEGYCRIALPTHGLITNCGKAHLEGFGGVEGVRKGKGELFDYLRAHQGTAFIMEDYDYLVKMSRGIKKIVTYGVDKGKIRGNIISGDPYLQVEIQYEKWQESISTHLAGDYNLPNVLAAVAIGDFFEIPFPEIKKSIESYIPSNNRSQMIQLNGNRVILDAYNANPSSMKLAIENMVNLDADQKILFLGGMMELGKDSIEEHQLLVNQVRKYPWQEVILVGGDFAKVKHPYRFFEKAEDAKKWLENNLPEQSLILIKGSRSMKMETVLEALQNL